MSKGKGLHHKDRVTSMIGLANLTFGNSISLLDVPTSYYLALPVSGI